MSLQTASLIGRDLLARLLKSIIVAGPFLTAPLIDDVHGFRAFRLDGLSIKARVQTRAIELLRSQAFFVNVRRATPQHRHDPNHHNLHSTT